MLRVTFSDKRLVGPGLPFHECTARFEGPWIPDLPARPWQDVWARDPHARFLALAAWAWDGDDPGFRMVVVATHERRIVESGRFRGCCMSLRWGVTGFDAEIFGHLRVPGAA